ncbi:unnamed protein product [Darwinula stevensoni]|uniref:5'-3' exonuclease domain-containing protein n=1 Tax=Darwinula stevensoni TaxID=69355 RepID=A0A7R9AF05_9CRUS|nr:unnamed protein product [Darwinula stevensoni]CAG0902446.1 unnamed protein product [Darwinula stevensoni]
MMKRLRDMYPNAYGVCVFDAKGPTFRHDAYPDYKANRPPMPEELVAQIEPIHQAMSFFGWPIVMMEGVEADDVIGTLATQASLKNWSTIIATGDKDMAQLVNERVTLINTMSNESLTVQGVLDKFGVRPDQIIDYLALMGDAVDNVPGVDKVGPKTAVKWLTQYQTLEGVIAHAEEIKGVVGDNLRKSLDWLPKGRELLTIKCDVDLSEVVGDCKEQLGSKMIMQVHDELVFEVPDHEVEVLKAKIPQIMSEVLPLKVPVLVEVGVGDNWEQAH